MTINVILAHEQTGPTDQNKRILKQITVRDSALFSITDGKETINNFHLFGTNHIRHLYNFPRAIITLLPSGIFQGV